MLGLMVSIVVIKGYLEIDVIDRWEDHGARSEDLARPLVLGYITTSPCNFLFFRRQQENLNNLFKTYAERGVSHELARRFTRDVQTTIWISHHQLIKISNIKQ